MSNPVKLAIRRKNARRAGIAALGAALLALLGLPVLRAQQTDRAKQIGGKFMCMCGCNQVLTQCNHVGCTVSTAMLSEIDDSLAQGKSEHDITQMLVQQYGTMVFAEPPKSGFSLVAWWMAPFYLVLGTIVVVFVIFRWRRHSVRSATAGTAPGLPGISEEALARARTRAKLDTED